MFSAAQLFAGELLRHSPDQLLSQLRQHYAVEPNAYIDSLLPLVQHSPATEAEVSQRCADWIHALRRQPPQGLAVEALLQEFPLARNDGLALMSLAEALLRIPDPHTLDAFIQDRLGSADWHPRAEDRSEGWLGMAHRGLQLAGYLTDEPHDRLDALTQRLGQPLLRRSLQRAVALISEQFVMGETIFEALDRSQALFNDGDSASFDMLGEAALCQQDVERYLAAYHRAIEAVGRINPAPADALRPSVSIKLSALHPRFEWPQRQRWLPLLAERVSALLQHAQQLKVALTIDAEETDRLESTLLLFEQLLSGPARGWGQLGLAVQAYSLRALPLLGWLTRVARQQQTMIPVRLVKGAYWDSEIKWAQQRGLARYPVFTHKVATDIHYLACARYLFSAPSRDWLYPQFATHNARTLADLSAYADDRPFEYQRLHGMGVGLYREVRRHHPVRCRIYAPVGQQRELLPYLIRRLLENGANSSFVNQLYDPAAPIARLSSSPCDNWPPDPRSAPPLPPLLYHPQRANSPGRNLRLHNEEQRIDQLNSEPGPYYQAAPMIDGIPRQHGEAVTVMTPQDHQQPMGEVYPASAADAADALQSVQQAQPDWANTPVEQRAACLTRLAQRLEDAGDDLLGLLMREAGKTRFSAQDELREAIDFCHYYAAEAQQLFVPRELPGPTGESNRLLLEPRGVFLCISPWNFPLAILLGQVTAALVTGNGVIIKPARQTPLIAFQACQLLLQAGVPPSLIALLTGPSEHFSPTLLADARINGVAFTGSGASATIINRALAARERAPIAALIAETGGQNAMIVDSSALPEQVVKDVLEGAFGSAGQRCSALRLLCLQDEIADHVEALILGALAEWVVGDPSDSATDCGPVIDAEAQRQLLDYLQAQQRAGRLLYQAPLPAGLENGSYVCPAVIRLQRVDQLGEEQFGPLLHIVRYSARDSLPLVDQINRLGYGLTLAIHSRNARHAEALAAHAKVGNIYINRHQTGAVVGCQPFGGCGLSGTGPKAGGPHYLQRFVYEKQISTDTTAWGGNASLLGRTTNEP